MEKFTDTIRSLNEKLVAGQVTSVELVEEAIRRIKAENDVINAVITLDEENALAKAKASDEQGYSSDRPLQGIPIGLKDNILTNGVTTTAASKMLADFVPIYDATVTEKLAEAGAINIAKLNMDEFAMGGSAKEVVEAEGLVQLSDPAQLLPLITEILDNNQQSIDDYKAGKKKATGFLVGQIMKATKGQANPQVVNQLLTEELAKR